MAGRAFTYDDKLLRECAGSNLAAFVATDASEDNLKQNAEFLNAEISSADDKSCISLFKQHATHYNRQHSPEDAQLEWILSSNHTVTSSTVSYRLGKKLHNFIRNVLFVYDHNVAEGQSHRVALNRFSDLHSSEVIGSNREWDQPTDRHLLWENEKRVWEYGAFDDDDFQAAWGGEEGVITSLSSSRMIRDVAANLAIGKGSINKLTPKHKKEKRDDDDDSYKIVEVPLDDPEAFEAPSNDDSILDGTLMSIKESQEHRHYRKHSERSNSTMHNNTADSFETNLDWATTNNPDGVGIVHGAFDQVSILGRRVMNGQVVSEYSTNNIVSFSCRLF
jgi:hypothetical protein